METEATAVLDPVDGAVLMGGCDKSTPALLMGAASVDLPAVFVPAGPMLPGHWRGRCRLRHLDMWKYWDDKCAGLIGDCEMTELESGLRGPRGTASAPVRRPRLRPPPRRSGSPCRRVPASPPSTPATTGWRPRRASRIVELVRQDRKLSDILTADAFEDAVTTVLGLGGSTNAVIHLIAMAGRAGVTLTLDDFDLVARTVPVLANVWLGGPEVPHGGLPLRLRSARVPVADHRSAAPGPADGVVRQHARATGRRPGARRRRHPHPAQPGRGRGGVAVLRGNLCPDGAVIKHIAAEPQLLKHTSPRSSTMIPCSGPSSTPRSASRRTACWRRGLRAQGGPGMPEYGMLPLPDDLLKQGVRNMVRISDARTSGTSYGACAPHVAPDGLGDPRPGPHRGHDHPRRRGRSLQSNVDDAELERRRAEWTAPPERYERGYGALYNEQITQADTGCDFAFLARPGKVPYPYAG